ncbi:SO2930 family diheme c-type cytochrome [Longitalea luteola]|uniref:SO2930 family diheme c-type cytochrome n=1 Tax=Longitalea luteola TaxID=2812563 RepID=UPI001A97CB98|nr:SO2930 family diheme c-type cytochrome [Longitalea luteola]
MPRKLIITWLLISTVVINLAVTPTVSRPVFERKQKLSEYNFFTGKLADLQPAPAVIPYEINSELFSNYAQKMRFIKLPNGSKARYTAKGALHFPQGTVIIKNFYYENDFRKPGQGRKVIETRLLVNEAEGWTAYPYVWNDEQTEAFYDVAGDVKKVSYINGSGKRIRIDYIIPNKNQCKGCHIRGGTMQPIGPTARQLNRDYIYTTGKQNQLSYWQQQGLLTGLPDVQTIDRFPSMNDQSQSLEVRARAYLDVNCGTCHHPQGPANTSGLFLHYGQDASIELGIMKSPVAAGRGAGRNRFDIVPGKPHKSILAFRMQTNDPGIAMPELGREQIHREGVQLINEWIRKMKTPDR